MPNHRKSQANRNKPWHAHFTWRNIRYSLGYYKTWEEARIQEIEMHMSLLSEERSKLLTNLSSSNLEETSLDVFDIASLLTMRSELDIKRDSRNTTEVTS